MSTVLITGGTGSFGSAMAKRIIDNDNFHRVVIFSRDEKKQFDMRNKFNSSKLKFVVGDVRDKGAVKIAMQGAEYVFHAAALKQVPTGEFFPLEMVKTNILGTQNVLDSAIEIDSVKKVICLSTDKAVYPMNSMGISKAMLEKLTIAQGNQYGGPTIFCVVRYGNVMATRGSVIPYFIDQIKAGKNITVTDPKMTRFLLSLDDAMDLVVLALEKGEQGDIFIKKAPAANMGDLAQALVDVLGVKNKIEVIGTRAGEKIHETLATQFELMEAEDFKDYFRIKTFHKKTFEDFYTKGVSRDVIGDYTSSNTTQLSVEDIKKRLLSLDCVKDQL